MCVCMCVCILLVSMVMGADEACLLCSGYGICPLKSFLSTSRAFNWNALF